MVKTEFKVGPLTLNFRILLEPKGFLRIIMLVVALLAFSLTAGFNSTGSDNETTCLSPAFNNTDNVTINATERTLIIEFEYPYGSNDFRFKYRGPDDNVDRTCREDFSRETFAGTAEYFVAMGVLTMIYVIAAVIIYIVFITPELSFAKWLVIGDFFATIVLGVFYLLADISWSAGAAQLNTYLEDRLVERARDPLCLGCSSSDANSGLDIQNFGQPIVSIIFGWLATFLWFASIWFVYKDTMWHKDRTGPLAPLYQRAAKRGEGQAEEGGAKPSDEA